MQFLHPLFLDESFDFVSFLLSQHFQENKVWWYHMHKLFPLKKVWKNQHASVADDKLSTDLSRQCGERTDAEHKLFSRINAVHRHYSSFGLKGQGSLMVLICGDGPSFLDLIAARWRTGRGDSAALHWLPVWQILIFKLPGRQI